MKKVTTVSLPLAVYERAMDILDADSVSAMKKFEEACKPAPKSATLDCDKVPSHWREKVFWAVSLAGDDCEDVDITVRTNFRIYDQLKSFEVNGYTRIIRPKPKKDPEIERIEQKREEICREELQIMLRMARRKGFPLKLRKQFFSDFECTITQRDNRSNGGFHGRYAGYRRPSITLNLGLEGVRPKWIEYKHIAKRKTIGSFEGCQRARLSALVAHELAHAIQYAAVYNYVLDFKDLRRKDMDEAHGDGWQEIYRYFRTQHVNKFSSYKSLN